MKPFLTLILSALVIQFTHAQPGSEPRRRDSVLGGGWSPWHNRVTQVPVLINPALAKTFQPREKLCFDKKIFIKSTGGSRNAEIYLFVNTEDGYVGVMIGKDGMLGNGDFKTNDIKFRLMVMGRKGNVYSYFNQKKKGNIEHLVSTGNTETHLYHFGFSGGNDVVHKKTVRNMYCGDKFKTWSYKADGGEAPMFHLFGRNYPNKLVCKDFLGYSGIGFLNTDEGIYIACEMEKGANSFEMREFNDVEVCFDPAEFREAEQEMFAEMGEKLEQEKQKLDDKTFSGDCAAEKTALNNYKKELVEKKKRNKETAQSGNVYQNRNVQQAYANLMDPGDMIQEGLFDIEVKICKVQKDMSKASSRGQNTSRYQEKLNCYSTQKSRLISAKAEIQAINARYPNDPGKAYTEKIKVAGRNMQSCN